MAGPAPAQDPTTVLEWMRQGSTESRHGAIISLYHSRRADLSRLPEARYLVGHAWMRIHRPDEARPYLIASRVGGFEGYDRWDSVGLMLDRARVVEEVRPPLAREITATAEESAPALRAYAAPSDWSTRVLRELPSFVERALQALGKPLPPIDMYLFESWATYERFFSALFVGASPTPRQRGTGNRNVVVYCKNSPAAPVDARHGTRYLLGEVLHEYAHALLATRYGDLYLERVPGWLNEGLADCIAEEYFGSLFEASPELVRAYVGAHGAPPPYKDLCHHFYDRDEGTHYAVGRLLAREMLGRRGVGAIRDLLEAARGTRDFGRALEQVCGRRPEEAYRALVESLRGR
ncbi:MAG: hypothetical protein L0216_17585 [Planctomycetales bacterium]|nr:hypothetical protein [Planctomycetales bacterium]